jgi:hypothetical protein
LGETKGRCQRSSKALERGERGHNYLIRGSQAPVEGVVEVVVAVAKVTEDQLHRATRPVTKVTTASRRA